MGPRIALVDLAEGTVLAVRAALGAGAVRVCRRGAVPAGTALVIVEAGDGAITDDLGIDDASTPVLVLADWTSRPAIDLGRRRVDVLEKPFGSADLRLKVRALLEPAGASASGSGSSASRSSGRDASPSGASRSAGSPSGAWRSSAPAAGAPSAASSRWLREPLLEASAARTLAAVRPAGGAVWLVGEPGTGVDDVAAALALASDPGREPVIWQDGEPLASALPRLDDAARVLWAPAIDEREAGEQRSLERYLAIDPRRRIIVTGSDDPESAVAAGTLAESLVARLSRTSLRLAPLRERRRDLAALGSAIAADVAGQLAAGLRVVLTERAKRSLEAYDWPHNLVELESVLTRTVLARMSDGNPGQVRISGTSTPITVEIDADDLLFAPMHLAPLYADDRDDADADAGETAGTADAEPAPRRALVVALGDVAAARASAAGATERSAVSAFAAPGGASVAAPAPAGTSAASAAAVVGTAAASTPPPPAPAEPDAGIEGVLAGFAHDIRNPMSTIKTFAGLEASREGSETAELARLAAQACERVDEQLELLQRYSEIREPSPAKADLVEILGEATEAAGAEEDLVIAARRALPVEVDAALARLVADAIVAECRARRAPESGDEPSTADIGAPAGPATATLEITIPTGRAAVDRLDKWVAGTRFPWRLALARDAARRAGGALEVDMDDGELRVAWHVPAASAAPVASAAPGTAAGAAPLASAAPGTAAGAARASVAGAASGASVRAPRRAMATNEGGEAVGEGKHDDQAGSPDRRRRSRSS